MQDDIKQKEKIKNPRHGAVSALPAFIQNGPLWERRTLADLKPSLCTQFIAMPLKTRFIGVQLETAVASCSKAAE